MAYLFNFEFRLSWRDWRRFSIREALDRRDKTCPKISSTNFNNSLASAHGYFLCGKVVSVTDFGLAVRWIRKECLARFAIGAGYDEVPLEGYALG
jgi:hypothetical protein